VTVQRAGVAGNEGLLALKCLLAAIVASWWTCRRRFIQCSVLSQARSTHGDPFKRPGQIWPTMSTPPYRAYTAIHDSLKSYTEHPAPAH
jgi:hypothetical protein